MAPSEFTITIANDNYPSSGKPFLSKGFWWFWDEAKFNIYGPYKTEEEAIEMLKAYIKEF